MGQDQNPKPLNLLTDIADITRYRLDKDHIDMERLSMEQIEYGCLDRKCRSKVFIFEELCPQKFYDCQCGKCGLKWIVEYK